MRYLVYPGLVLTGYNISFFLKSDSRDFYRFPYSWEGTFYLTDTSWSNIEPPETHQHTLYDSASSSCEIGICATLSLLATLFYEIPGAGHDLPAWQI